LDSLHHILRKKLPHPVGLRLEVDRFDYLQAGWNRLTSSERKRERGQAKPVVESMPQRANVTARVRAIEDKEFCVFSNLGERRCLPSAQPQIVHDQRETHGNQLFMAGACISDESED
jgi:hypothetical protein